MLAAALGGSAAAPIVVCVRGAAVDRRARRAGRRRRRPGDPALVGAAATGVRRGARVVVVAPYEGPLRDATAGAGGRAGARGCGCPTTSACPATWPPGLAVLQWSTRPAASIWPRSPTNWTPRRCATAPAANCSPIPPRRWPTGCPGAHVVLAGDTAATLALARHGAAMMLRVGHQAVAAVGLADALVAMRTRTGAQSDADREAVAVPRRGDRRAAAGAAADPRADTGRPSGRWSARGWRGLDDVDVVGAEDVPDVADAPVQVGRPEQQLAMLAVRLEMARSTCDWSRLDEWTCYAERCGPMPGVRGRRSPNSPGGQSHSASRGRAVVRRPPGGPGVAGDRRRRAVAARCGERRPGGTAGRGGARTVRRRAAVPGEGARRRRTAVAAGPPERRAGRRGFRAGGPAGHSGVVAGPQLPRPQPQARTAGRAAAPSRRWPGSGRAADRRVDAGAGRVRPRPVHRTCWPASPTPTACARCSPPGSPRRSPISTCWCPP